MEKEKVKTGKRIRELLHEKDISQRQLAEEIGVSYQTVNAWIKKDMLPTKNKRKIAEFFDVDADYIVGKQNERKKGVIMEREKTLPEQLEEIANIMCEDYCRYPREWDEEDEGVELCDSEVCAACPLNKLT